MSAVVLWIILYQKHLLYMQQFFIMQLFVFVFLCIYFQWYVARSLGFSTLNQSRFKNDAILLHCIDLALVREGLDMLNMEQLQSVSF